MSDVEAARVETPHGDGCRPFWLSVSIILPAVLNLTYAVSAVVVLMKLHFLHVFILVTLIFATFRLFESRRGFQASSQFTTLVGAALLAFQLFPWRAVLATLLVGLGGDALSRIYFIIGGIWVEFRWRRQNRNSRAQARDDMASSY